MTLHTKLSYGKSALRLLACVLFVFGTRNPFFVAGSFGLMAAEIIGVVEELPAAYKGTKV